jgi:hypothetical protein
MGALVVALYLYGFHLAVVLVACVVFSLCATFFGPASQALLPEIVPRSALDRANGLFESSEAVVGIAGSAAAGALIVTLGAVPSLGIDAASFGVAALFVALLGATAASSSAPRAPGRLADQVREGLAYLGRTVGLLELTIASLVLNFLFAFLLTFLVVYSTDLLHGGALVYAILEALLAAGWGAGGLLVGKLRLTRHTGGLWAYSAFAQGLILVVLVLEPTVPVAFPLFLAAGVMQGVLNVAWLSTVQAVVPERLQGRYFATDTMASFAAIPVAQVAGGLLIASRGVPFTFLAAGIASIGAGVGLVPLRELRRIGYDPGRSA